MNLANGYSVLDWSKNSSSVLLQDNMQNNIRNIYLYDIKFKKTRKILENKSIGNAKYLHDNNRIIFTMRKLKGKNKSEIYKLNIEENILTQMTNYDHTLSGINSRIVIHRNNN